MTALEHRRRRHRPRRSQRGAATAAARAGWARQRCVTFALIWAAFSQLSSRVARAIGAATVRHLALIWAALSQLPSRVARAIGAAFASATVRLRFIWAAFSQLPSRVGRAIGAASASSAVRLRFTTAPSPDPSLSRQRRRMRIRRTITETAGRDSLARVVTLSQLASVLPRVLAVSVARTAVRLRSAAQLIAALRADDWAACRSGQPGRCCHALTAGISSGAPARGLVSPHCVSTAQRRSVERRKRAQDRAACRSCDPRTRRDVLPGGISSGARARCLGGPHGVSSAQRHSAERRERPQDCVACHCSGLSPLRPASAGCRANHCHDGSSRYEARARGVGSSWPGAASSILRGSLGDSHAGRRCASVYRWERHRRAACTPERRSRDVESNR